MWRRVYSVNILDPHGESLLNHAGIGQAFVTTTGQITQVQCGVFAGIQPIPTVGTEYVITGDYLGDPKMPFTVKLPCTVAARLRSDFQS